MSLSSQLRERVKHKNKLSKTEASELAETKLEEMQEEKGLYFGCIRIPCRLRDEKFKLVHRQ